MLSQQKKFHRYRGSNVILNCDDTVACRKSSYANALVFSELPLNPYDVFLLEIEEIERGWSGDMRIGLTTMNPNEARTANIVLPQYALPDLSAMKPSWIFCISKSSIFNKRKRTPLSLSVPTACNHVALQITFKPPHSSFDKCATDVGSQIGVVFVPISPYFAELHFVVNGVDQGVFANDIPHSSVPLFVVVDVYGCTKKVRVIELRRNVNPLQELCREAILHHIQKSAVSKLPLPKALKDYLLRSVQKTFR